MKLNHIAIIPDGNRRQASMNGLSQKQGHEKGSKNIIRTIMYAKELDIPILTVQAFSTDNWKRSESEVKNIENIVSQTFIQYKELFAENDICFKVIGKRSDFTGILLESVQCIEDATKDCSGMTVNIGINYDGKQDILQAMQKTLINKELLSEENIQKNLKNIH